MNSNVMVRGLNIAFAILILIVVSPLALMADVAAAPAFQPGLNLTRSTGAITVDGNIDDTGWRNATHISQFWETRPGDNTTPGVRTDVYVTYDDEKLYVAFDCKDDPAAIRATMCQRDQFGADDAVAVFLDTYGNGSWAYQLFVNPYGVQKDQLWSISSQTDASFDLAWESAGKVTPSGYQVEIAVPFASLRFPAGDIQSWRMDFKRYRPRESYNTYAWAAYDRSKQCVACQYGTVAGISGARPGKGIEVLPAFVGHRSGERTTPTSFSDHDPRGELSVGGKYTVSSGVTLEATMNPDFSQIEADATQIDVNSTIALMYPERRPFFQEGSDIFFTLFNSFYTRTVADPTFAAKVTGRLPKASFGLLSAVDNSSPYIIPMGQFSLPTFSAGRSVANIFRGVYSVSGSSQVGVMLTDRRYEKGGIGSIMSGDFVMQLSRSWAIDGQYLLSYTKEMDAPSLTGPYSQMRFDHNKHTAALDGEAYWGTAFVQRLKKSGSHFNMVLDYNQITPSYRTHTGYDPVNNHRTTDGYFAYTIRPAKSIFETITPSTYLYRRWSFDGRRLNVWNDINLETNFRTAQTSIQLSYRDAFESFADVPFDGLYSVQGFLSTQPHKKITISMNVGGGTTVAYFLPIPEKAKELSSGLSLAVKPIDRLTIEPRIQTYRIADRNADTAYFDGYIARTRVQLQASKEISIRLVAEYNDFGKIWSLSPLLTYRLSPFSLFYIGSTLNYADWPTSLPTPNAPQEWKLDRRQYFMKLQYLFQV